MIEWEATGIVLGASPLGEGDAVASVLTEAHGLHRGLVRGGMSRRFRAAWETGNVLRVRWRARLAEQLGTFTGEAVGSPHAGLSDRPVDLAVLTSACAVARDALPERSICPDLYAELLLLLARLGDVSVSSVPLLVRWEVGLLAELGFGLSLDRCAVSGAREGLLFVSPRTGRAVTAEAARGWTERLLRLPAFLAEPSTERETAPPEWSQGLALTGHFLTREVFGAHHRDLPAPRVRLASMVQRLVVGASQSDTTSPESGFDSRLDDARG